MASLIKEPQFLDFGNAPELFAHGLHDLEIHGSVVRFILFMDRMHQGENVRVPVYNVSLPLEAVAPAIAMTIRRIGGLVTLPEIARRFLKGDDNGRRAN